MKHPLQNKFFIDLYSFEKGNFMKPSVLGLVIFSKYPLIEIYNKAN